MRQAAVVIFAAAESAMKEKWYLMANMGPFLLFIAGINEVFVV